MFTAKKFNWERENSDQFNPQSAPFDIVYKQVYNQIVEENSKKNIAAAKGARGGSMIMGAPISSNNAGPSSSGPSHQQQIIKAKEISGGASFTQLITQSKKANSSAQKLQQPGKHQLEHELD